MIRNRYYTDLTQIIYIFIEITYRLVLKKEKSIKVIMTLKTFINN